MESSIRWLDEQNELPILVMPNAGMPINEDGNAVYKMTSKTCLIILETSYTNTRG